MATFLTVVLQPIVNNTCTCLQFCQRKIAMKQKQNYNKDFLFSFLFYSRLTTVRTAKRNIFCVYCSWFLVLSANG